MTIIRSGCKINLGLKIGPQRPDGYHDLQSFFLPLLNPGDTMEIKPAPTPGLHIDCNIQLSGTNLIKKAYDALSAISGVAPPLWVKLHKSVPPGAGLGGGSANAAVFLTWLNEYTGNPLNHAQMRDIALNLGCDVPFFLFNLPALVEGKGEKITPLTAVLSTFHVIVVWPQIHISTATVFSELDKMRKFLPDSENCLTNDLTGHKNLSLSRINNLSDICLDNDLEKPVLKMFPALGILKRLFMENGAQAAGMSGSGSSFYGLFEDRKAAVSAFRIFSKLYKFTFFSRCHIKALAPA